jgi:outer membrane protein
MDNKGISRRAACLAALLGAAVPVAAVDLDLEQALKIADEHAFGNRMAQARELSASGGAVAAWAGFVPTARVEVGASATDDPLGVFATRLGQRHVSQASFDPALLNRPDAIAGFTTSLVAEIPLVNLDAWQAKVAADRNLQAMGRSKELERNRIRAQVVEAWFAVGLARAAQGAWESGLAVARSYESQAVSGHRNEIATRSDVLRSRVEAASIGASLAKARSDVQLSEKRLALLLGGGPLPGPVSAVDMPDSVLLEKNRTMPAQGGALETEIVGLQSAAAEAGWHRARDAFLPRLNAMAKLDWKDRSSLFGTDPSWSVGVVASWNILGGAQVVGAEREARGRWREAQAGSEARCSQLALERDAERARLATALERLEIQRGSLEQAVESHRIVSRRYEEGLATIAERIEAGSLETKIRLEAVSLRQEIVSSLSKLALLEGRDPSELVSLTARN